jgi:hypothetical protein
LGRVRPKSQFHIELADPRFLRYIDEACTTCLLLITNNRDAFFELKSCRSKIVQSLSSNGCLGEISKAVLHNSYSIDTMEVADLRHFLYKSKSIAQVCLPICLPICLVLLILLCLCWRCVDDFALFVLVVWVREDLFLADTTCRDGSLLQFTSPTLEAPYNLPGERERLFRRYQAVHHRIHSSARPLKIYFHNGQRETLLGWITVGFELYACFGPLVTKPAAINAVLRLIRWMKREEDGLFIQSSLVF